MSGFAELGVTSALVDALGRHGIVEPFGIQRATLADALAGRDVLGRAPTGSGKTVAFALPLVSRLATSGGRRRRNRPRALVLVPTRELAAQVERTVGFLAKALGLRTMTVFGGVGYTGQLQRLSAGVDVVIATPGRLEDLVAGGACDLSAVEVVVLDEADLMADMGFLPPVRRLLALTPPGQRLLFSATLDGDVDSLVAEHLHDPVSHDVGTEAVVPADQFVFLVTAATKLAVLVELLGGTGRALVFAKTKRGVTRLAEQLAEAGLSVAELHGNLSQSVRRRNLADFAAGSLRVLVATDVAARGLHIDDVALVVHADPPAEAKSFLHRSGRTARAGAGGVVVTLCLREQNRKVKALLAAAGLTAHREVVEPGGPLIAQLRGAPAPARRLRSERAVARSERGRPGGQEPERARPRSSWGDPARRPARGRAGGGGGRGVVGGRRHPRTGA